ncbi:MAG TPA: hypothetical protein VMV59_08395 [Candidatus Dormibacteraeota bacterium]|nr:hypothetical protein [Candidatus Dormibacteraeota bacterium]
MKAKKMTKPGRTNKPALQSMRHRPGNIAGENQSRASTVKEKPRVDKQAEEKVLHKILRYLESMDSRIVALEQKQAHRERMDEEHRLESLARPVGSPGEMN